jgi:DNA primase
MHVEEFVELLGAARPVGRGKWNASCPAHLDRSPSLSVTEGSDRILIHCHAGCALGSILVELGLTWHDIFYDTPSPEAPPNAPSGYVYVGFDAGPRSMPIPSRRRATEAPSDLPTDEQLDVWERNIKVVAHALLNRKGWSSTTLRRFELGYDGERITIPVREADGKLVSVLRYKPGAERKMLAPRGAGRFLFPAPERVKVSDVWLVEGEPDAISAFELGLPAVAVPGVATWKPEWVERFRGRAVTICFDSDIQGRNAVLERREQFAAAGIPARAVDLAPKRVDGYDLSDALLQALRLRRLPDLRFYLRRLQQEAWT